MADFSLQLVMQSLIKNSSKLIGRKSALCLVCGGFCYFLSSLREHPGFSALVSRAETSDSRKYVCVRRLLPQESRNEQSRVKSTRHKNTLIYGEVISGDT
jgi:hypothetical protein